MSLLLFDQTNGEEARFFTDLIQAKSRKYRVGAAVSTGIHDPVSHRLGRAIAMLSWQDPHNPRTRYTRSLGFNPSDGSAACHWIKNNDPNRNIGTTSDPRTRQVASNYGTSGKALVATQGKERWTEARKSILDDKLRGVMRLTDNATGEHTDYWLDFKIVDVEGLTPERSDAPETATRITELE